MTEFTPIASFAGGMLVGAAAVMLMAFNGRIAGISGILVRLLPPYEDNALTDRIGFVAGLIAAPLVYSLATGSPEAQTVSGNLPLMAAAGILVGLGAVYGGGCTSGHGVCGLSRLSVRSLAATATFMATGFLTVLVVRHMLGD